MPTLIGAIAFRVSRSDETEEQINCWQMTRDYEGGAKSKDVLCPKCGESYALVEELDATDEVLKDDMEFLAKALSTGHPWHPARLIIRDPNGLLYRHFDRRFRSARNGNDEPTVPRFG